MALWNKVKKVGNKLADGVADAIEEVKGDPEFTIEELTEELSKTGVCPVCGVVHSEES